MSLTSDQKKAMGMLQQFIECGPSQYFSLMGIAGTGKSFMLGEVLAWVRAKRVRCVVTATTNKAVQHIDKTTPSYAETMTIHRFLGLKVAKQKGVEICKRRDRYDPTEYMDVKVVFVDEASMADKTLCEYIKKDVESWGRKYVAIGDPCQLPPVDSSGEAPPLFKLAHPPYSVLLTQVVRQAEGNPIIRAAGAIRNAIEKGVEPRLQSGVGNDGEGVHLLNKAEWEAKLRECIHALPVEDYPDVLRTLAWRNETVNRYNDLIREELGKVHNPPFEVGETVVMGEAFSDGDAVLINTGVEARVSYIRKFENPIHPTLICWAVKLDGVDVPKPIVYLDRRSRTTFEGKLKKLKDDAISSGSWGPYYAFQETFADLRPVYSMTTHKAQGSTFENVFVDLIDIYRNRRKGEADRCLYTAITRASKTVYIRV